MEGVPAEALGSSVTSFFQPLTILRCVSSLATKLTLEGNPVISLGDTKVVLVQFSSIWEREAALRHDGELFPNVLNYPRPVRLSRYSLQAGDLMHSLLLKEEAEEEGETDGDNADPVDHFETHDAIFERFTAPEEDCEYLNKFDSNNQVIPPTSTSSPLPAAAAASLTPKLEAPDEA